MSFTYTASGSDVDGINTIRQSGTDTDISGLNGVTGVTTTTVAGVTYYTLGNTTRLIIQGTLTHKDYTKVLVLTYDQHTGAVADYNDESATTVPLILESGSVFNLGEETEYNGVNYRPTGTLIIIRTGLSNYPLSRAHVPTGANIRNGATLNWNSGTIQTDLSIGNSTTGGEINIAGRECVFMSDSSSSVIGITDSRMLRIVTPDDVTITGMTYDGLTGAMGGRMYSQYGIPSANNIICRSFEIQPRNSTELNSTEVLELSGLELAGNRFDYDARIEATNARWKSDGGCQPIELTNIDVGTAIRFNSATDVRGYYAVFQEIDINARDGSGVTEDVLVEIPATYRGRNPSNGHSSSYNYRDHSESQYALYSDDTDASGDVSFTVLTGYFMKDSTNPTTLYTSVYSNTNTLGVDDYTVYFYSYGHLLAAQDTVLHGTSAAELNRLLLVDPALSETTRATVDAYTEIDDLDKLYDRAKSWKCTAGDTTYPTRSTLPVTADGDTLDLGDCDLVIDKTAGSAFAINTGTDVITIKADALSAGTNYTKITTTGTISTANDATIDTDITYTDTSGTTYGFRLKFPNIIDGSRYQIYNVTQDSEMTNALVSGGSGIDESYIVGVDFDADDEIRYRITYQNGANAKTALDGSVTAPTSASESSNPVTQTAWEVYESAAIDGSTVTECDWDGSNLQIDVDDPDDTTTAQRIGAWYGYYITTEAGIDALYGAVEWPEVNKLVFCVTCQDVTIENVAANPLIITGGWISRSDGSSVIDPASSSIQIDPPAVFSVETGVSGLTPTESEQLNTLSTEVAELHDLQGLDSENPMTVTPTSRVAGDISLAISGDGVASTTVTRS
jgi:hypothetical protein